MTDTKWECSQELLCLCALRVHDIESSGNNYIDLATMMRDKLKELESIARDITDYIKKCNNLVERTDTGNVSETIAQSILAMRHIEDARMRYGKVIQYVQDGVSVYDKQD